MLWGHLDFLQQIWLSDIPSSWGALFGAIWRRQHGAWKGLCRPPLRAWGHGHGHGHGHELFTGRDRLDSRSLWSWRVSVSFNAGLGEPTMPSERASLSYDHGKFISEAATSSPARKSDTPNPIPLQPENAAHTYIHVHVCVHTCTYLCLYNLISYTRIRAYISVAVVHFPLKDVAKINTPWPWPWPWSWPWLVTGHGPLNHLAP